MEEQRDPVRLEVASTHNLRLDDAGDSLLWRLASDDPAYARITDANAALKWLKIVGQHLLESKTNVFRVILISNGKVLLDDTQIRSQL